MDKKRKYTSKITNLEKDGLKKAGLKAQDFLVLSQNSLPIQSSFVLLTEAFDDNLIANSLIEPISEIIESIEYTKEDSIKKGSEKIKAHIEKSEVPLSIKKELINSYKTLSGSTDNSVNLIPSYPSEELVASHSMNKQYKAFGNDNLISTIKQIWKDFFSEENIKHRHESEFEGDLTLAVIVQKEAIAESSGMASNFDNVDNNESIITIEGVYGIWDDKFNQPDIYKVAKKTIEIVEKHVSKQEKMIVRTRDVKSNFRKVIDISPNWAESQKIDDSTINSIAKATLKIEEIIEGKISFMWAKEADKIFIIDFKKEKGKPLQIKNVDNTHQDLQAKVEKELKQMEVKAPNEFRYKSGFSTIPSQSEKEGLKLALSGTGNEKGFAWGVARIVRKQSDFEVDNPKTILVISEKFNVDLSDLDETNAAGAVIEGEEKDLDIPVINNAYKPDEVIRENEVITIDSDSGDVFVGAKKTEKEKYAELDEPKSKPEVKSEEEEQAPPVTIPTQDEIKTGIDTYLDLPQNLVFPKELTNIDGGYLRNTNKINDYAQTLESKPLIVNLDAQIGEDKIQKQLKLIHKFRNKDNHRNIWVSFRNVLHPSNLADLKKSITSERLRRSSSFNVLIEIDNPTTALGIEEIISIDIDGVILNVKSILEKLFGEYDSEKLDSKAFEKLLDVVFEELDSTKIKVWLYSPFEEGFLKTAIKRGIFAMIVDPDKLQEIREFISKNEIKKLKKKKKRGRKRKS